MELFVIIVNGFQPLIIITKNSILDVTAVLDPPLKQMIHRWYVHFQTFLYRKDETSDFFVLLFAMDIWYFIYMCLNKYFDIVALEKSSYLEEK